MTSAPSESKNYSSSTKTKSTLLGEEFFLIIRAPVGQFLAPNSWPCPHFHLCTTDTTLGDINFRYNLSFKPKLNLDP